MYRSCFGKMVSHAKHSGATVSVTAYSHVHENPQRAAIITQHVKQCQGRVECKAWAH